jgi:precorrin-2/cobalt-factor-2 C20-methyltransferase
MIGKLYGIGVGPGDPELLTFKALRIIKECDMILIPSKDKVSCTSYQIVKQVYPLIDEKDCLFLDYPMTKDRMILENSRKQNEELVREQLNAGKSIAFLTLGDPCIYSTYSYLEKAMVSESYEAETVSGVPSFCAVAAKLGISLSEENEEIHIIPATYGVAEIFELPGTKILMKAGKKLEEIKRIAKDKNCYLAMAENCGMQSEKIMVGIDNIPDSSGYFTTVIIK